MDQGHLVVGVDFGMTYAGVAIYAGGCGPELDVIQMWPGTRSELVKGVDASNPRTKSWGFGFEYSKQERTIVMFKTFKTYMDAVLSGNGVQRVLEENAALENARLCFDNIYTGEFEAALPFNDESYHFDSTNKPPTTLPILGPPFGLERHPTNRNKGCEQVWYCCRLDSDGHDIRLGRNDHMRDHLRDHKEDLGNIYTLPLNTDGRGCNWHKWRQEGYHKGRRACWLPIKTNAALNFGSALGMGGTFLWLSKSMDLHRPSAVMSWVTNTSTHHIPAVVENTLQHVPDGVVFAGFATATAIFTGTTFAWVARTKTRTPVIVSTIMSGLWIFFWLILGVTVEELILVCVPLSISFGILASCLWRPKPARQAMVDDKCRV